MPRVAAGRLDALPIGRPVLVGSPGLQDFSRSIAKTISESVVAAVSAKARGNLNWCWPISERDYTPHFETQ